MTDLAHALPKNVLMAVDRYRALYGIRSRAKALERMVQAVPLEVTLRNAPKLPKGSVSPEILEQLKQAESEPRVSLQEVLRNAPKLPKGSVSKKAIAQFEESRHLQAAGLEEFVSLERAMQRRNK